MTDRILQASPRLEILNSHFTRNFSEWALGFCGGLYEKDNPGHLHESNQHPLLGVTSLNLSNRCIHNLVDKKVRIESSFFEFLSGLYVMYLRSTDLILLLASRPMAGIFTS